MLGKVDALLTRFVLSVHRHPQRLAAVVAALLLSMGGGAFALVSMDDNTKDVVVREVIESIPMPDAGLQTGVQNAALLAPTLTLFRTTTTRNNDTADLLLKRVGVFDAVAAAYLRHSENAQQVLFGRVGRVVTVEAGADNGLLKLTARWVSKDDDQNFQRLVVEKTAAGLTSRIESAPLVAANRLSSGTINTSLFAATDEAAIPDAVSVQLAEIFSGQIDFHRALRKGDRFSVVYETLQADDEPLRSGRVLSAEFVNNGKTYQAMWFQEPVDKLASGSAAGTANKAAGTANKGGYYALDGTSLRRAYLTSPMEFSRITSGFSTRFHPILQKWKAHLGVDYGAPTGTAVRSVGDGVVDFAGVQNGFGNVVIIKHRNNNTTLYAHLSRIDVHRGQTISQSDKIGAVGATGWATGPHLHFEFRVAGVHHDPLTIANEGGTLPVSVAARPMFDRASNLMRMQLKEAASVVQASAD
ncbi:MAG: peptidoglycan DD-metalloendopeptidase family protein [Burkholderiaceae bacterium]|nr:peptidoglycan DD-metalloendopeptidase family protein [Burkholderiaceae bacterium]